MSVWVPGEAGTSSDRLHAPATLGNREAILAVLREALPSSGLVLEVASGSGEHAAYFAAALPGLDWQPSDPNPAALASIEAWRSEAQLPNLHPPVRLDAAAAWPVSKADAILCINMQSNSCDDVKSIGYAACVCINMVHISEWAAMVGLFTGCAKLLPSRAPLILYGPYLESDVQTAPSNLAFDRSLKERNPEWGLRNVADVDRVAADFGFALTRRMVMPANNLTLVYHKG